MTEALGGGDNGPRFDAAGPAHLVRGPRTVAIEYACDGENWHATSPQVTGFAADGPVLAEVQVAARKKLGAWLDPEVTVTERIIP